MASDVFSFSGKLNYIEWYECYDDPSSKVWVDGMELRIKRGSWDQRAIDKWNFFYRPVLQAIGRPQKKRIKEREAVISACEAYIQKTRKMIVSLSGRLRRAIQFYAVIMFLGAVLFIATQGDDIFSAIGALIAVLGLLRLGYKCSQIQAEKVKLEKVIQGYEKSISLNSNQIHILKGEIRALQDQMPKPVDASIVSSWLHEEIKQLELVCLGEFLSEQVTEDAASKHIERVFGDPRVLGILIDSWGFLQPLMMHGPLGRESTGLSMAQRDLDARIATWQAGPNRAPLFRLWYFQFVLPLAKNLNICSFLYDFVTRRPYGRRWETFQYNHVTNFSIREIDPSIERGAKSMVSSLGAAGTPSLKAVTIATSSGIHFRCTLVDEDLKEYFNRRLNIEAKEKLLRENLLSSEPLDKNFNGDGELIKAWRTAEKERIDEELREMTWARREIEFGSAFKTRAMLGEVRRCVEEYVARTEASRHG